MDIIQLNKFSKLHNGKDIFFCKTDYLYEDFKTIENLNNDVTLITGNSDYPITDDYLKMAPKNITKWFGQNILSNNVLFEPIPLGLENKNECFRAGHGVGYYERVQKKESLIKKKETRIPYKKIYANFKVDTNIQYRNLVKNICLQSPDIEWGEPNLSLEDFFNKILDYDMIVCPAGNGVDTHRLWEVLYSGRIPITVKVGNFKIYELYEKYPIIVLDSIYDLLNSDLIYNKFEFIRNKIYNLHEMDSEFWVKKILKCNYKITI